jgi:acetoin:2,6-dichlorophenolindophenol oxidoreductase subunit alpha
MSSTPSPTTVCATPRCAPPGRCGCGPGCRHRRATCWTSAAAPARWRGTDQVAVCFFGDGALGQGLLYESMNMASLWRLPVVYVCENNLYNEYTHYSETTAGDLAARSRAFGVEAVEVDGQDVEAVHAAAAAAVGRARPRDGGGPSFLLCHTYRYVGHHVGDVDRAYRSRQEEDEWRRERDPITLLAGRLSAAGAVRRDQLEALDEEVRTEVADGVAFALAAPFPDPSQVTEDVYA